MLQTGDVILVTGAHASSRKLVQAQRLFVPEAKSSHAILAHGETLCIDAAPAEGVRQRFLLDVLLNIEPTWEVIRLEGITDPQKEAIIKAAAYYLNQGYLIHPTSIIGNKKSYCSELVRKVYVRAGIQTNLPESGVVMPGHFDRLINNNLGWSLVTPEIKSWVETVAADEATLRNITDIAINGLKLNRKRFEERKKMRHRLIKDHKKGKISQEKLTEMLQILDGINDKVNYKFWDYK